MQVLLSVHPTGRQRSTAVGVWLSIDEQAVPRSRKLYSRGLETNESVARVKMGNPGFVSWD